MHQQGVPSDTTERTGLCEPLAVQRLSAALPAARRVESAWRSPHPLSAGPGLAVQEAQAGPGGAAHPPAKPRLREDAAEDAVEEALRLKNSAGKNPEREHWSAIHLRPVRLRLPLAQYAQPHGPDNPGGGALLCLMPWQLRQGCYCSPPGTALQPTPGFIPTGLAQSDVKPARREAALKL